MEFFFNTSENQPMYKIIEDIKDGKKDVINKWHRLCIPLTIDSTFEILEHSLLEMNSEEECQRKWMFYLNNCIFYSVSREMPWG